MLSGVSQPSWPLFAVLGGIGVVAAIFAAWFLGKASDVEQFPLPPISLQLTSFKEIDQWGADQHQDSFRPFLESCKGWLSRGEKAHINPKEALGSAELTTVSGTVADWREVCERAQDLYTSDLTNETARVFFERNFRPFLIFQPTDEQHRGELRQVLSSAGLFTGYFEPAYRASSVKTPELSMPVLARPDDLVMVDLGEFREDLAGQRIAGRVRGGKLTPFETHASIVENGLDSEILAWMDPNDLLFLQIQGSGKLLFDDDTKRVGYNGQNGHPYTAIGRYLIEWGEIAREEISMQSIYEWLENAPREKAEELRYLNASYVFFKELNSQLDPELGPIGAQGVQLTAGRSIAVDRRYFGMGLPLWVNFEGSDEVDPMQRLMIAQDTGGAIKGAVRGDVFVGSGAAAGEIAGLMKQTGQMYVLLPVTLAERIAAGK